jgi:hypothetical protein
MGADQFSQGRFDRWAWCIENKNSDVLTFDYRNVGQSRHVLPKKYLDNPEGLETYKVASYCLSLEQQMKDLKSVLQSDLAQEYSNICLVTHGSSFLVYLKLLSQNLELNASVKTVIALEIFTEDAENTFGYTMDSDQRDMLCAEGWLIQDDCWNLNRNVVAFSAAFLEHLEQPYDDLLKFVRVPVLIINPAMDTDQMDDEENSAIIKHLPHKDSKSIIVASSPRGFWGFIDTVGDYMVTWIDQIIL